MSLTVPQAAQRFTVTEQYIRKLLSAETIKGKKVGRDWQINERSAKAYFGKEHKTGPKPGQRRAS
jgi:excisionase family DNA binding protein